MPDGFFSIDIDSSALLAALARLGPAVEKHTKPAAKVTADAIANEARNRVARRTGQTAEGIHVEEDRAGGGYVVLSDNARMPNLPIWLEFGTVHMTKRPFFFASAALEAGAHERRMVDAVQAAIDEEGLGE